MSVANTADTQIYVSASYTGTSTNAVRAKFYNGGAYQGDKTFAGTLSTTQYFTYTGLSPAHSYSFSVQFLDSGGSIIISASTSGTTTDTTVPIISVSVSNITGTGFDITYSASDDSGIDVTTIYVNGAFFSNGTTGGTLHYSAAPNTYYSIEVYSRDNAGNTGGPATASLTTPAPPRPSNFSWTYPKNQNGYFNLTASEWTNLQNKCNDFRQYKGISLFSFYSYYNGLGSFTSANSGQTFYYYHFNQVRNAIDGCAPPVAVPSSVSSGQRITAKMLNDLRDSLNSIS